MYVRLHLQFDPFKLLQCLSFISLWPHALLLLEKPKRPVIKQLLIVKWVWPSCKKDGTP